MKNQLFPTLIFLVSLVVISSCSKELVKVNINPNNLEKVDPTTLLSNTLVSEFYNNSNVAWGLGNGYNQYMTYSSQYNNQSTRYLPVTNEPYWIPSYQAARDANTLYATGLSSKNTLLQAIALTLRSYAFAQLTELWGDIPFLQALKGSTGLYTPAYDDQQVVYTNTNSGILPSLKRADSLLKANPLGLVGGDLLFNSSVTSWRRLINALRLRYLLRVSSKLNPAAEMQSIVTDGALLQDATQSGSLTLPLTIPYNFVSLTERSGDYAVKFLSSTLFDQFTATGDTARIANYFSVKKGTSATAAFNFTNYGGIPLVFDASSAQIAAASNFNTVFTTGANKFLTKARIMTYAEQQFILAEAVLKGFVTGSAASYYNQGVLGAYAEIGLDPLLGARYLTHSKVIFDNSSLAASLSQIITQKWLTNINNGFEGWIEFRRTGYPVLQTGGTVNLNGGVIPSRFLYPTSEKSINSVNYTTQIGKNGGKELTTSKAWWEK